MAACGLLVPTKKSTEPMPHSLTRTHGGRRQRTLKTLRPASTQERMTVLVHLQGATYIISIISDVFLPRQKLWS